MSNINLMLGDCAVKMKEISDNSVDLTVTSPPYDNLRNYNGYSFDFETIAKELYRVTKPGGVVIWIVGDATIDGSETGTSFKQALYFKEIGFNINDTMIWLKPGFTDVASLKIRYAQVFEYMFVFTKGYPKTFNPIKDRPNKHVGERSKAATRRQVNGVAEHNKDNGHRLEMYGQRYNVWEKNSCVSSHERLGHPAPFPEGLVRDHIISWSNEGDTVLDPFLGSGTTGVVSKELNRNFIGIEISEEYMEIARKRISNTSSYASLW